MPDDQSAVIAFLKSPATHGGAGEIEVVQTHGALVFLAGDTALKMKRAVRFDYMDLSTLALREAMLRRELALNQPVAPQIYRDVIAVTRAADGNLALNGTGAVVEWLLRMWRFPARDELSVIAERGGISPTLAEDLGQGILAYHRAAPLRQNDGSRLIRDILQELDRVFADMRAELGASAVAAFQDGARLALDRVAALLVRRGAEGHVRRCHGDLHLRNLVMIDGKPVPFDALEFDEVLGTCDVLYDLAFLIMDLRHRGLHMAANIVLNSYLLAAGGAEDAGLAALPLFLAVRAAIRAMVAVQTARAAGVACGGPDAGARGYLGAALAALAPAAPRLIAVGGLSGTGKTSISRQIAPDIGTAPGAVHLRSDLERKALQGVAAQARLGDAHYGAAARADVYRHMLQRAATVLAAGHSVLLDATFLSPETRAEAEALATRLKVGFCGLWLEAPQATLLARVGARQHDASDADAAVVRQQLTQDIGAIAWQRLESGGPLDATVAAARAAATQSPPQVA